MDMQDKELDELFRSKLDDFEQEPSARVWPGISAGLVATKRRTALVSWLSIAASILVLAMIGVVYLKQKPVESGKGDGKRSIAKITTTKVAAPAAAVSPSSAQIIQNVTSVTPVKAFEIGESAVEG